MPFRLFVTQTGEQDMTPETLQSSATQGGSNIDVPASPKPKGSQGTDPDHAARIFKHEAVNSLIHNRSSSAPALRRCGDSRRFRPVPHDRGKALLYQEARAD